jgi:hypothetical protein
MNDKLNALLLCENYPRWGAHGHLLRAEVRPLAPVICAKNRPRQQPTIRLCPYGSQGARGAWAKRERANNNALPHTGLNAAIG